MPELDGTVGGMKAARWSATGGWAASFLLWPIFYLSVAASWAALAATGAGRAEEGWLQACLSRPGEFALPVLFDMWALMVLAMMLPTSLPYLRTLFDILAARPERNLIGNWWAFLAAYVLAWLGFALVMALAQHFLASANLPRADDSFRSGLAAAILLGLAGLYQFSRLKHACLSRCRAPMTFFMAHWRNGGLGAVRMGLRHGLDCLGCCWALMALALLGGAMNLALMALGTGLMLVEKLAGSGHFITYPLGFALLIGAGVAFGGVLAPLF